MRSLVSTFTVLTVILATGAEAADFLSRDSADRDAGYSGGRGLITYFGQTGLFLNPTSGTAYAGDLSLQSCALIFDAAGETVVSHAVLATYGVTDWLEVGLLGLGVYGTPDVSPGSTRFTGAHDTMGAAQGNVRVRLLKDEGAVPEVSVGGMYRAGDDYLRQEQLFIAASKGFAVDPGGIVPGIRLHAGFRQLWQDRDVKERDGSIVFAGLDIGLPHDLHLVGEVSTKDDVYRRTPFSVGVQWRDPRGYGASLAFVRSDDWREDAAYVGIGFNF